MDDNKVWAIIFIIMGMLAIGGMYFSSEEHIAHVKAGQCQVFENGMWKWEFCK